MDETEASINPMNPCSQSQGNSNDAISTSGQIDESNFGERNDILPSLDEPIPGPSTSSQEVVRFRKKN